MRLLPFVFVLFIWACNEPNPRLGIPAIPSSLDTLYDTKVSIQRTTNDQGVEVYDTIKHSILKIRKIFRKGIQYVYRAQYIDANGTLLTDNTITLIPTGERWSMQPEMQDIATEKFGFTEEEKAFAIKYPSNYSYDMESRWTSETQEGMIENTERVWMHPFRHNQYIFTEICAFPEILLPPEKGKQWKKTLSGLGGWGDWDGLSILSSYHITGKENLDLKIGKVEVWVVESTSSHDLGNSTATFYFHENLGFVKKNYTNYYGQRLIFELISVEEINP